MRVLLIVSLLCAVFATGCAENNTTTNVSASASEDASTIDDADETKDDVDEAPPESAPPVHPVTVTLLHALTGDDEELLVALTKEFNETNTAGVTATLLREDADDDAIVYDMRLLDGALLSSYSDVIAPLDDLIGAGFDRYQDVVESFREEASATGKVLGLPFDMSAEVFYYNSSMFEEEGLSVPATWDDLLAAGEVFMENRGVPVIGVADVAPYFETLLAQSEAGWISKTGAQFNNADGLRAARFLTTASEKGYLRYETHLDALISDFTAMRIGGIVASTTDAKKISSDMFELSAAPLPAGTVRAARQSGSYLALFTTKPDAQTACWEYMKYLTSDAVSAKWAIGTGCLPVRYSAYDAPEYRTFMEYDYVAQASFDQQDDLFFSPQTDAQNAVYFALQNRLGIVLSREIDADDALDEIVDAVNEALRE